MISLRQRLRRLNGETTGSLENAARELPSVEELDIPAEVLSAGVPLDYTLLFWSVWRKRGMETEYILARWREMIAAQPPRDGRKS